MYSTLQEAGISAKRVFLGDRWQILLLDSRCLAFPMAS